MSIAGRVASQTTTGYKSAEARRFAQQWLTAVAERRVCIGGKKGYTYRVQIRANF